MKKVIFTILAIITIIGLVSLVVTSKNNKDTKFTTSSKSLDSKTEVTSSNKKTSSSSESSLEVSKTNGMDLDQISQSNYSSIAGTWVASDGAIIKIDGNRLLKDGRYYTLTNYTFRSNVGWVDAKSDQFSPIYSGLILAPAGTSPIDETNAIVDSTDTTKDRLTFASNGGVSLFQSPEVFFYKN